MEWAGTLHLSWWELREFVADLQRDPRSSFFKRLHPKDYHRFDPLTEVANIVADLRMFSVIDRIGEGEIPDEYLMRFGPPDDGVSEVEADPKVDESAARARAVAAEMRG